jgi:hypothetical protein
MDCHATSSVDWTQSDLGPDLDPISWPAQRLLPLQRQALAVQALAGAETVSELARQNEVSRKFLYQQIHTAEQALDQAFAPPHPPDDVLFYLPVTKPWIEQLVLGLVLTCHSSYRGVIELLGDLFDYPLALGTVHNIVTSAIPQARWFNQQYDLSTIDVGAHDEIFQADAPVLVGVDTASTFCYLLSLEEHRDAETWGIRLLELADCGFAPEAIVADAGSALRAGQALALPAVPCRGDVFHLLRDMGDLAHFLERRAYEAIAAYDQLLRKAAQHKRQGHDLRTLGQRPNRARAACDAAIRLYDDVALLLDWLRHDILAVAGPSAAERLVLYDFVVAELKARVPLCPHRIRPIWRALENQRDDLLAFARTLDDELERLGKELRLAPGLPRRVLLMLSRDDRDRRRWVQEQSLREILRGRFFAVCEAVAALARKTVRASSLVENLNSRLRNYFFLRRHLGAGYLSLLQFFLNHRRLERSDRPERVGKSPAELLTGVPHPHWLHLLGYRRFTRG